MEKGLYKKSLEKSINGDILFLLFPYIYLFGPNVFGGKASFLVFFQVRASMGSLDTKWKAPHKIGRISSIEIEIKK